MAESGASLPFQGSPDYTLSSGMAPACTCCAWCWSEATPGTHDLLIIPHLPGFVLGGSADAEGTLPCSLRIMPCPDEALDMVGRPRVQLRQEILEGLPGGGLPTAHAYHPAQHRLL